MSEKSKGDTSRVVNNPLLSASVTGFTFDDFPSAPHLLPAAPPIERSPPPVLDLNADSREPSHGQGLDGDSAVFSEINLNATSDEDYSNPPTSTSFISPLEENPIGQDSSLLSQAASSFSQLPTVASTVFSTFSKVIKDYTPTSQNSEDNSSFNSAVPQVIPAYEQFYAPEQHDYNRNTPIETPVQPQEPPKFYSPAEIPTIPSAINTQNTNQNTYRLSAKKKTYAQIPGLSAHANQPATSLFPTPVTTLSTSPPPSSVAAVQTPIITDSNSAFSSFANSQPVYNLPASSPHIQGYTEPQVKREERRGLFSFSNVVAPVLQNLSGLVGRGTGQENQTAHNPIYSESNNTFSGSFGGYPPAQPSPAQYFGNFGNQNPEAVQVSTPNPNLIPTSNTQQHYLSGVSTEQPFGIKENDPPVASDYSLAGHFPVLPAVSQPIPTFYSPSSIAQVTPPHFAPSPSAPPYFSTPTPPLPPATNIHPNITPPLLEKPSSAVHQVPPVGPGNNFRLQKGTRHYRAPLGIPTNPAVASNLLQPVANSNPEPIVNQPFAQFSPVTTVSASQLHGTSLNPNFPSYPENNQAEITQLLNTSQTHCVHPTTSSAVHLDATKETVPLIPSTQSAFNTLPPQADNLQNFFCTSPNIAQPISFGFSQIPCPEEKVVPTSASIENTSNYQEPVSQIEGIIYAERKISFDKGLIRSPDNFAPIVATNLLDESTPVLPIENTLIGTSELSTLTRNLSIDETKDNNTDVLLSSPSCVASEITHDKILDLNQTKFEDELTAADVIEIPNQLAATPTQSAEKTQSSTNTVSSANLFNLNQYFNTNTSDFNKPPTDLNANKPFNETAPEPETPFNLFTPTYQIVADNKNNNPVPNLPDPLAFFDSFQPPGIDLTLAQGQIDENYSSGVELNVKSDIQIQNFFNNPPQTPDPTANDLNYKLVGSNLIKTKYSDNLSSTSRPISPLSNVVEPPSSACSEFSADASVQSNLTLSKLTNADIPDGLNVDTTDSLDPEVMAFLGSSKNSNTVYQPAVKHWFYKKKVDEKLIWTPFSHHDSALIESHFNDPAAPKIVAVEGGRYDVNIDDRLSLPIYWSGDATEVRRCSWFYKAVDSRYVPYEEPIADKLEIEYEEAVKTNEWHRKIPLPTGETVVFHGATVLVHFLQTQSADSWGASTQTTSRPRIVKRDLEDFNIETGESNKVDHLLFMVHGIGSVCDLKFRTVEEVVDEFRNIATQLIQSHYKNSCETGRVGRVEVLPVSWHSELHSEESGVDEKLKAITLESIPKLRNFTNDTLLDILFYTSPVFCQNIMDTVAGTMNKVYAKYCQRNPTFNGGVSLAGHSLGSLILFDLLCHQKPIDMTYMQNSENPDQSITPLQIRAQTNDEESMTSKQISYTIGSAGTGQPSISYPQLVFQPTKFFALGSPIGMFVTIRGIDRLGLDFMLPTCSGFYNIFHPYDPVAYRIEALVNSDLSTARPVLVPHHKGRKRMHLELKETMTRVGADIKQRIVDTFKNTFGTVYQLTAKQKTTPDPSEIEREVDKVLEMQLNMDKEPRSRANSTSTHSDVDTGEVNLPLGKLNEGKRIDYVLQEAPLEFFNEYLFALTSHVCYWESADTILFLMKEIYSSLGVQTDSQSPQLSMTIERPLTSPHPSFSSYDHSEQMEYNN